MLDFFRAKLPVVNRIQAQSNKFSTGVENETSQVTQTLMTVLIVTFNCQITWGRYRILEKGGLTDYQRQSPVRRSRVGILS